MKSVVYKTTVENLEGEVELKLLTFDEKYDYFEAMDIDFDEAEGDAEKAVEQIKKRSTKNNLKTMRKMISLSLPHYIRVEIKNKETGEEFKSVDDLQYGDGHNVLIEMATKLIHGSSSGNAHKPQ